MLYVNIFFAILSFVTGVIFLDRDRGIAYFNLIASALNVVAVIAHFLR